MTLIYISLQLSDYYEWQSYLCKLKLMDMVRLGCVPWFSSTLANININISIPEYLEEDYQMAVSLSLYILIRILCSILRA